MAAESLPRAHTKWQQLEHAVHGRGSPLRGFSCALCAYTGACQMDRFLRDCLRTPGIIATSKCMQFVVIEMLLTLTTGKSVVLVSSGKRRTLSVVRSHGPAGSPGQPVPLGIGISFRPSDEGVCVVADLARGGPAQLAGVREGDLIREIDGVSCEGLDVGEMIRRIKGPSGSNVTLTLEHTHIQRPSDPPSPEGCSILVFSPASSGETPLQTSSSTFPGEKATPKTAVTARAVAAAAAADKGEENAVLSKVGGESEVSRGDEWEAVNRRSSTGASRDAVHVMYTPEPAPKQVDRREEGADRTLSGATQLSPSQSPACRPLVSPRIFRVLSAESATPAAPSVLLRVVETRNLTSLAADGSLAALGGAHCRCRALCGASSMMQAVLSGQTHALESDLSRFEGGGAEIAPATSPLDLDAVDRPQGGGDVEAEAKIGWARDALEVRDAHVFPLNADTGERVEDGMKCVALDGQDVVLVVTMYGAGAGPQGQKVCMGHATVKAQYGSVEETWLPLLVSHRLSSPVDLTWPVVLW